MHMSDWTPDNPLAVAWCAGLIDGEACISISRCNAKTKIGTRVMRYTPSLHVNMVHLPSIKRLQVMFGGAVYRHSRSTMTRKQAWTFGVTGQKAVSALRLVRPFLFAKADEADAVIGYYDLGRAHGGRYGGSLTPELAEAREQLCVAVRDMKTREWTSL